jgi:hypothetical protein
MGKREDYLYWQHTGPGMKFDDVEEMVTLPKKSGHIYLEGTMKKVILLLCVLLIFGCSKKQEPIEPEPETFKMIILRNDSHPEGTLNIYYKEEYTGYLEGERVDSINPSDSIILNGQKLWGKCIGMAGSLNYDFLQNEKTYIFANAGWQTGYSPKDTMVNTSGLDTLIWDKPWWFSN